MIDVSSIGPIYRERGTSDPTPTPRQVAMLVLQRPERLTADQQALLLLAGARRYRRSERQIEEGRYETEGPIVIASTLAALFVGALAIGFALLLHR